MKKIAGLISPYLLIALPILIGLGILFFQPNQELVHQDIALRASFINIPSMNLFEIVLSIFKCFGI